MPHPPSDPFRRPAADAPSAGESVVVRAHERYGRVTTRSEGGPAGGVGDAVLRLDATGRVVYANLGAAHVLGAQSPLAVVGADVAALLREGGQGIAALALQSAADAVRGRAVPDAAFTVHDAHGAPTTQWYVTPHGAGVSVVARPTIAPASRAAGQAPQLGPPFLPHAPGAASADAPAAALPVPAVAAPAPPSDEPREREPEAAAEAPRETTAAPPSEPPNEAPSAPSSEPPSTATRDTAAEPPAERHASDALVDLARDIAGAADQVDRALEQLAAAGRALLGGDGACVVTLDGDDARIAAANGSLAALGGQRTELHEPPSPLHDAIAQRCVVVSRFGDESPAGSAPRQLLVAPLAIGEQVAAALCVVTGAADGFTARDRALAERLAEHGALAVRNHRLYRTVERGARDARLLADAARILARHVTPQTLYPALAGVVREALGACGFTASLADPDTGAVELLYREGTGESLAGAVDDATFWDTAGGRVVREGRPLFIDGTLPDAPTIGDRLIAERLRGTPARAVALLPLMADETRGLLSLQFAERHAFDEPERRLLADFAAHVAVAVRNATLLAARERERDRAAAAAEIARVALDASSLDAGAAAILGVLDRLVPSSGKALSVLRDEGAGEAYVECAAAVGTAAFLRGLRSATSARAARRAADARVRPVIVDDLRTVLTPERCPDATGQPGTAASAVIVPLVARGRTLGDLAVTTPLGTPLGGPACDTLVQLAAPIALALDALLLGEERRRRLLEERQMTEQLRQAEKMAALGELVAGVAHEINNPLTGISAFAELLSDEVLTEDQRESVRLIKREADRVVGVVRDLLMFSRKTEPAYFALDLNELVERTLRLRSYALRAAGIDVRLSLDPSLPVVHGDEAKLQQVVLNVVLNAEHAMRDTPVRRIEATTRCRGDRVVLSMTDTGTGIAPDVLPRIFEPFFTTKPAGEGTGLGLSVSYGIVQAHGGELRVDSTPGLGTTLEIVLPSHPAGVDPADAALPSPTP